jgi:hypothetical protein
VRTGAETAFVREWTHFSGWLLEYPGADSFVLIQNEHDSSQFVSLGAWSEGGCTAPWATFLEWLGKCRALCEAYRSRTYKPAAVPSEAGRPQRGRDLSGQEDQADPRLSDDHAAQLRRGAAGDRLTPAHRQPQGLEAGALKAGR